MSPRKSRSKGLPWLCILIGTYFNLPKKFFDNLGPQALTWTCCTQTQCADSPRSQPPSWWKSSALGMCWVCELQCPSLWQHHWGGGWWWLGGSTWRRWMCCEGILLVSRCCVGLSTKSTHLKEPLTTVNLWGFAFLWDFTSVDQKKMHLCTNTHFAVTIPGSSKPLPPNPILNPCSGLRMLL